MKRIERTSLTLLPQLRRPQRGDSGKVLRHRGPRGGEAGAIHEVHHGIQHRAAQRLDGAFLLQLGLEYPPAREQIRVCLFPLPPGAADVRLATG